MQYFWSLARYRCALLAVAMLFAWAGPARGEGLTERLLADAADGRFDELDFSAASLIASGAERPDELAAWLSLYRLRREEVLAAASAASERQMPAALHCELHGRVLTGRYERTASDLRLTLGEGNYNCLSALALYYDCCRAAGIEVEIWLRRGHVFARIEGVANLPVEPGSRHLLSNPPPFERESARQLSPSELLGKFYYNRGIEQLELGRFEQGVALLEIATQLDPHDADAQGNLVAGLNNWAVTRLRERQYDQAAMLIERGLARDAAFAPLVANERLLQAMRTK